MNIREIIAWFENKRKTLLKSLSYGQKISILLGLGIIVGLSGLFFYLLRMQTYIVGDDPKACINCHIMSPYYATWSHSSHARNATCNDCHMPYISEGGVKYTDHHIMSPLAHIDRTCQTCHRQDAETLRQNVYERQKKVYNFAVRVNKELAYAHIEAKFAWDKGATEAEMKPVLDDIRKSQWRWDYSLASHGAAFHAPQEVMRLLAAAMEYAKDARLNIARVVAKHGFTGEIPHPDISTREKAAAYIGLDMKKLRSQKKDFIDTVVPKWIETARKNKRFITKPM
jgi:nitrite reductase (cytochrome; ammonia-forming)